MVGTAARMRVSSVTAPFLNGTLKSTRTRARLPSRAAGGRSRRLRFLTSLAGDVREQVDAARGIAHFVVVPRRDVQERAVDHVRRERVHHARVEAADVI